MLVVPGLGNVCLVALLLFVVFTARETIKNRAMKKHQHSLRSRVRFTQAEEDVAEKKVENSETKVDDVPYKDIEAMYDLIPAEYLDSNDNESEKSPSISSKKSFDEDCDVFNHLFKEERHAAILML